MSGCQDGPTTCVRQGGRAIVPTGPLTGPAAHLPFVGGLALFLRDSRIEAVETVLCSHFGTQRFSRRGQIVHIHAFYLSMLSLV